MTPYIVIRRASCSRVVTQVQFAEYRTRRQAAKAAADFNAAARQHGAAVLYTVLEPVKAHSRAT